MPTNFIPLAALFLLIAGGIYLAVRPPPLKPEDLPVCDDAKMIARVLETPLIDEPKAVWAQDRLTLSDIKEAKLDEKRPERICTATLNIAARDASPANRYSVGYRFGWNTSDSAKYGDVSLGVDVQRTQLAYCDSWSVQGDVKIAVLESMTLTPGGPGHVPYMGDYIALKNTTELAFDAQAQKRRCSVTADVSALGFPSLDLLHVISWRDRAKGTIIVEVTRKPYEVPGYPKDNASPTPN